MTTLISAEHVTVTLGDRAILSDLSLSVTQGERLALLGRNGSGKTTLLHVLHGDRPPDEGQVWHAPDLRTAFLHQHHAHPPALTVQALMDAAHPYREQETRLLELETDLGTPATLDAWTALHARLEAAESYAWPSRVRRILGMLDLSRFLHREAATLSGGERTRLALALALAREPELLLLDEPTNHLDIRMREWLESWLRAYPGGVILTSHDRDFLDAVATRSLWLEAGSATPYPGGYSRAHTQRDLERRTQARAHRLGTREAQRLQGSVDWLDRRGRRSNAMKTRAARVDVTEAPLPERQITMRLLAGTARAGLVTWGEHLNKTYSQHAILLDAAFKLRQGDRVALMGANGTGKTTLMRLLNGELAPDPPEPGQPDPVLRVSAGVTVASLDQTWHGLTPGTPLHAQFTHRFGRRANAILGRAGFTAEDWPKPPETLSGGERARAGLALVSALRADLLLLDEPTNHLDVEALQALEAAVHAYNGAVVIVTHDRRFAREVANRLWVIEDTQLREISGWGSREYRDPAAHLQGDPPPPPPPSTPRQRMVHTENELQTIRTELDRPPGTLTGREEARHRARAHHLQHELHELYAEVYGAPQYDTQVREPRLTIRAQHLGEGAHAGGMIWAAHDPDCPHLAWDGYTLRFSAPPPPWYGQALLAGALRILFEHWNIGRAQLGPDGPTLTRRKYFEKIGLIQPNRPPTPPGTPPTDPEADSYAVRGLEELSVLSRTLRK